MNPVDLRLYGIADPERTGGRDLVNLVRQAVAGGATLVQYRDKFADTRLMVERARALTGALSGTGVPLLVNDRVDVALAAGADGVHLGQDDMDPVDARRLPGDGAIVGLTIKAAEQADAAAGLPIDYTCIGGVFGTASKNNPAPPVGLEGLSGIAGRVRRATRAPVGAIAGIDASNAAAVIEAGVDGVAIISALFMAQEPRAEAARLRAIVDEALASGGRGA